jgi:dextranase
MRAYYDYLVRYQEWLTAPDLEDWSCHGDAPVSGERFSASPEPGAIWVITRRKPGYQVIHLINLADQTDTRWNAPRTPPATREEIDLVIRGLPDARKALLLSPDQENGRAIPASATRRGDDLLVRVPRLDVWTTLVLRS